MRGRRGRNMRKDYWNALENLSMFKGRFLNDAI